MKVILALFLVCISADAASDSEASGAAIQKVIQMLGDMSAKAKQEKNDEQVAFAEFTTWCKMEQVNLKKSIKKGSETIELLSSSITKLTTEAKVLGEEVAKLNADVADFEATIKSSTAQRAKENKEFLAEEQDYSESVDAIDRAMVVLQKQTHDRPASALLQLSQSTQLPAKAQAMITAFMGMMEDADGVPEANAYEFQSSSIIDMLKKLKDDFRSKLAECQKEEMNSKHAFDMQVQDLTDSVDNSKSDADEKTATKARKQEKAALDKKELASTKDNKAIDETTLSDAETECSEKTASFDEKQRLRTEEIEAIQQAIKILGSEAAQGGQKHLSMAQSKATSSVFAQFRGTNENTEAEAEAGIRRHLREFLQSEGSRLNNKELALLAQKIAADPFAKVKKMIDGMITRLLNEANEDAQHEGFCDQEIGKSKVTRAKLSEDIDALTAAVEEGKSTIMMLTEEVATLSQEVADLDVSITEATKMRTAEKAKNKATVEDTSAAEKAVTAALAVLKKFYEGASIATALVQSARPQMGTDEWNALANPNFEGSAGYGQGSEDKVDKGHKAGMQTFGKTYQGQQDEAGGVLAMLEVIQSDFANVQADTKADEAAAQTAYDNFMTEGKKNKAMKERKIDMDNSDKAAAETKLQEDTKDLKGTQDELLAADRYYAKLVPQCFDKGMTFEERTAAREAEIASLKQALEILG